MNSVEKDYLMNIYENKIGMKLGVNSKSLSEESSVSNKKKMQLTIYEICIIQKYLIEIKDIIEYLSNKVISDKKLLETEKTNLKLLSKKKKINESIIKKQLIKYNNYINDANDRIESLNNKKVELKRIIDFFKTLNNNCSENSNTKTNKTNKTSKKR